MKEPELIATNSGEIVPSRLVISGVTDAYWLPGEIHIAQNPSGQAVKIQETPREKLRKVTFKIRILTPKPSRLRTLFSKILNWGK